MMEIITILTSFGGGSIAATVVQHYLNKNREKTDIHAKSLESIEKARDVLYEVVVELQKVACYAPNCSLRINGLSNELQNERTGTPGDNLSNSRKED